MHKILFIYNYINDQQLLDVREINTRRRDGILFTIDVMENYKGRQEPMYQAMNALNNLHVNIQNSDIRTCLNIWLKNSIINPYKKVE